MTSAVGQWAPVFKRHRLDHHDAPHAPANRQAFRRSSMQFARWLFDAEHLEVRYKILYDGIDIQKLSPGIVLLLLYLALEDADDRPLIIDQPEENLDSV